MLFLALALLFFINESIRCESNWVAPKDNPEIIEGSPYNEDVKKKCKNYCLNEYQSNTYGLQVVYDLKNDVFSKKSRCLCDSNNCNPTGVPNVTCKPNMVYTFEQNPSEKIDKACNDQEYKKTGVLTCNMTDRSGHLIEACVVVEEKTILREFEICKVCKEFSPKVTRTLTCEIEDFSDKFLRYYISENFTERLLGTPINDEIVNICVSMCKEKYDSTTYLLEKVGEDTSNCFCDINNCNPSS